MNCISGIATITFFSLLAPSSAAVVLGSTDSPSTLTLESAREGLGMASGTAGNYVDLAELARAFGDERTAGRFEQFARAKAAAEGGEAKVSEVDAALAATVLPAPRARIDYPAFVRKRLANGKAVPTAREGKLMPDPQEWIGVIMADMEKAGLENEAIRFALRNRVLAPTYVDPRLKATRAAWARRLETYAKEKGAGATLFGVALIPPYETFATGERMP